MEDAHLRRKQLIRFLVAVAFIGVVGGLYETTFNNYLAEVFDLSAKARGRLEFPREMPGFMVTLMAGLLATVVLNRMGGLAMLFTAVGLTGIAFCRKDFGAMVMFMVIWSAGSHLCMPVNQSIALSLASKGRRGARLGQMGMAGISGMIIGAGIVATVMRAGWISFRGVYLIAAVCAVAAGATILSIGNVEKPGQSRRTAFVFKRRYIVYYILSALFGARKQIFMTFGPWVIVRIFGQPAHIIAILWLIHSVLGLFFRPFVGWVIDRWGERRALFCNGILLMLVCLTYGIAGRHGGAQWALYAAMAAYIVDHMAFAVSMARSTYLSKIVERPEDLPGGLAAGVSIDHAVSMTVPIFGGAVWVTYGFQYVFWGAAVVALTSSAVSLLIRVPAAEPASVSEGPTNGTTGNED
ncbi:MAG: MFS transporter [Planctomycetota bacterium]